MNMKRTFGAVLTTLGIIALIFIAVFFVNTNGGSHDVRMIIIFSILGVIFFIAGINLIRTTKDE